MTSTTHTTRNGAILEITLDRPKANAINQETSREMGQVFAAFRDDPNLRVAILTGAGPKFFSAGWDLNEAAEVGGEGYGNDYGEGGLYGFAELPRLNKPVICAVNGCAIGAGFEILLAADFVIAADHAQMWLPETQLGIAPDAGTFLLPKILPPVIANEILLTGRRMSAAECVRWGLFNAAVPADKLLEAARELAMNIIKSAPLSIAAVKQTKRMSQNLTIAQCYQAMRNEEFPKFTEMTKSEDALEGPKAALEGRDPVWKGR